jgi:hypothetical protein
MYIQLDNNDVSAAYVWCDAILCAVFKKGDSVVYDNYRGIAVAEPSWEMFTL